jgi:hypothetical protein
LYTIAATASFTCAFANIERWFAGAARRLDLGLNRCELLGLASGDHDMGAQGRDFVRRAAADAAAAAGHDDGLALKQPRFEDRAIRHVSSAFLPGSYRPAARASKQVVMCGSSVGL